MSLPIILAIAGSIALIAGLFGGGVKAKELVIPEITLLPRIISGIIGIILIGLAMWLSFPNSTKQPVETKISDTPTPATSVYPTAYITATLAPKNTSFGGQKISIDSLPVKIYVNQSSKTSQDLLARSSNTLQTNSDSNSDNVYTHLYSFPEGDKKGAGLYFQFVSMINLEAYQYDAIEFTLNKKNPSDNITLALSDGNDYNFEINLKELFTSEEAGIYINGNTYIISLQKNFPNVSNVKYIYFWVYPPKTSGSIEYEVSGLKFIKP